MKITREQLKNIVREVMTEESEYQTFFKKALEKTGKSIPQMSDEEKKAFFNKIDAAWKGKGEKNERFGRGHEGPTFGSADEQVEELTKAQEKLPPALKKAIEKKEKNESVNEAKPKTKKEIESAINGLENYLKKNKYNDEVQKSIPPIIKKLQAQLKSVNEVDLREGMKKWKVDFKHTDGSKRTVDIEAFDKKRAEGRFKVNWGNDMKILKIYPATKKN